jgi:hypothetical protein
MANRTAGLGTKRGLKFVRTNHGGPPHMDNVPFSGGTTYYAGQILSISATSGSAKVWADGMTGMSYISASYVSATDCATTSKFPVYLLDGSNIFEAIMLRARGPQEMVGLRVAAITSSGEHTIRGTAVAAGTLADFTIVGFHPDCTATPGATGAKFYVRSSQNVWAQRPAVR